MNTRKRRASLFTRSFATTGVLLALFSAPASAEGERAGPDPAVEVSEGQIEGVVPEKKEKTRPIASAEVGLFSQYLWRGWALSQGSLVIQPSATVEYWGFSLNLWGNLDTDMKPPDPDGFRGFKWNETDVTVAWERTFGPVTTGAGYIYYALDSAPDSQEVYISLGLDFFVVPVLTVYREFAHYPGWYLNFGVSKTIEIMDNGIALDLGASAGYMDPDHGGGYFQDGLIYLGLTVPFLDYFSVTPTVAYSFYLSRKAYHVLKADSWDGKADHVYGGVTLAVSF